jgi:hypothetical protein
MRISREQFREIYAGLDILNDEDTFFTEPESDTDAAQNYLPSKLWRLNNIYTIVDKYGKRVTFCMNASQHKVYAAAMRHPRILILKSRQQGISTLWLVSYFDDAVTLNDLNIGLMAQDGDAAATLLERTKILWDTLSPIVKQLFNVRIKKDNTKEFSFTTGSQVIIRTSFRSATLQRLHVSEMGKIANKTPEKAKETKTGTLQALAQGMTGVIESTAEGENLFKDMWDTAIAYQDELTPKDFFPVFLSWLDDPDCRIEKDQRIDDKTAKYFAELEKELNVKLTQQQKNFWIVQRRELGDRVYQEYPSTPLEAFMATKEGTYYARAYMENIVKGKREHAVGTLYDKNLEVQFAFDLGMNDTMSGGAAQWYEGFCRIIDEVFDSGQDIKYYVEWMESRPWFPNLTTLILPHDAEVKELTSGLTREERFRELLPDHVDIIVLPKVAVQDGIEMVRQLLEVTWIDKGCEYIKKCLLGYHKEWDEKRDKFRNKPEHDEYSNGADMVRYLAMGLVRANLMVRRRDYNNKPDLSTRQSRAETGGMDV